ncbi:MAG: transcriptional regulator [Bacteroidetes bacterium]|nr:transcriptional regulator [Bacteroidota bacterium]
MKLNEAKKQFISTWGRLGSEWGINRSMAQVHALLLITDRLITTEEVMESLNISRGNANMNLRDLINWTLVKKEHVPGERIEYFTAEKDIWEIAKRIVRERKRREIGPVVRELEALKKVEYKAGDPEGKRFVETVNSIHKFASKMDTSMDALLKADENWFFGTLMKAFR